MRSRAARLFRRPTSPTRAKTAPPCRAIWQAATPPPQPTSNNAMLRKLKIIIPGLVLASMLLSVLPIGAPVAHAVDPGVTTGPTLAQAGKTDPANDKITCNAIDTCILFLVYWAGPGIAGGVAYIGAYFFSIVVQLSLNSTAYALDFLSTGWTTVRDIANMAFIFILIYIALTVMLAAVTSGTIKTLAVVIVIALLVNFSFFFTRVVIDAGNIVAVQFYNAIPSSGALIGNPTTGAKDLSLSIMGAINPQELLNSNMLNRARTMAQGDWGGMAVLSVIYLSVAAIFWILFFAFLQVGIKFMMRIVGLWFVLIASPLAFVARTMPKTKHFFDQWLDYLIKYSFYPAIFLFMFWILTKFTTSILSSGDNNGISGNGSLMNSLFQTTPTGSSVELGTVAAIATVAIRMGFVIAVLYVGLKVSDWIVKEGSAVAGALTGKVSGAIGGSAKWAGKRAGGVAYTYGVGRPAYWGAKEMAKTRFGNTWVGYKLRQADTALSKVSIGGAKSYTDVQKARDVRKKDQSENLRDIDNRELASKVKPIIERNIAAGEKAETGIDAKDLTRIQELDKRQIGSLNADNIKILSHVFTESQNKATKDLEKITEREKDEAHANWENHSPHALVRQAQKEIELLRDINTKLGGIPTLAAKISAGITIKSSDMKDFKNALGTKLKDVNKQFEDARLARDTATMAALSATRQTVNDGLTQVKELEKKFEKTNRAEIISPK